NRVDDVILFHPLGKEELVKIVELRLEDLRGLLADRKISLEVTETAKELLFTEGYDPNFGARPLKRAIQKLVQDPLALKILDGAVLHGDHVVVDADKETGKMTFKVSERVGEKVASRAKKEKGGGSPVGWTAEGGRRYVVLGGALNWPAISPRDKYNATTTRTIIPRPPKTSDFGCTVTVAAETGGTSITIPMMAISRGAGRT